MSPRSVQYLYARDAADAVVSAEVLLAEREAWAEPFRCLGCEAELVAKVLGKKKAKHFAHKPGTTCAPETYLHRLGKEVFRETYLACLASGDPFSITLTHPRVCTKFRSLLRRRCDHGTAERTFDLTRYYNGVRMEKRDGAFVPDLLLFSQDDPERKLYVEIAVTHFLSEPKQASGERIIEIPVEREEDIVRIRARHLSEKEARFVGFAPQPAEVVDAECACGSRVFFALIVYESGKSILKQETLPELVVWRKRLGKKITYARLFEPRHVEEYGLTLDRAGSVYVDLLAEAQEKGFPVRNCFLCRYGAVSWDSFSDQGAFCKITRRSVNSNLAVRCEKYKRGDTPVRLRP
ncbi:MAG: competence protein CoiA family protein [Rhodothermales bacterium]